MSCSNDHVLQDQIASVQCIARPPECAGHDETIPVQSALDSIFPIVPTVGLTQTIYHVMEDEGMAEVCIAVMGSLVPYPFHIIFTVKDGTNYVEC